MSEENQPLRVVGIGASAGGLKAIEELFDAMPTDTGMAFVLIQHLSPDYKSLMNELLARHTQMEIIRVEGPTPLAANTVFLIPPKKNMVLRGSLLELVEQDHSAGANYPIDQFFTSLAAELSDNAVAIVLSGTGSDGSRGIRSINRAGGLVLVQSVESAAFDGMPLNAIATQKVDVVCAPEEMPERILNYLSSPGTFVRDIDRDLHGLGGEAIDRVFRLFRQRYGIDFSLYKPGTVDRRIERRMQFSRISSLDEYFSLIEADPSELARLYRDLLVEVTRFFRDPPMYEHLAREVIPELVRRAGDSGSIRIWVAGCATGEEAYSLAIRFHAVRERLGVNPSVKIFATDVHNESLEVGSVGVYSSQSLDQVTDSERERYFAVRGGLYHVNAEIRRMVIFARHDLSQDPPFTRLDMISCRNLLIYFQPEVQQRAIAIFHFGLRVGGALVLGPSETVRPFDTEFDCLDNRWKIYRKIRNVRLRTEQPIALGSPNLEPVSGRAPVVASTYRSRSSQAPLIGVFQSLLSNHLPPSLLTNERGELLHVFGEAREFLSQPEGPVTTEVLKLLQGELRVAVFTGLYRARLTKETTVVGRVPYTRGDERLQLRLSVEPIDVGGDLYMLISISVVEYEVEEPENLKIFDVREHSQQQMTEMERELDLMQESLQTTIEELETSNEELQATNEELVASNEELQSTNEELQSVNEELHTVNSEHQRKIQELIQVYNDLDHLIKATGTAILYLDGDLRIRRFTDGIRVAFNLLDHDIGRPIDHISHNLVNPHIMQMLRDASQHGEDHEMAVATHSGGILLMRILPYVSQGTAARGVLVTVTQGAAMAKVRDQARFAEEQSRRSDRDLVEFAYAVSHDLQAGLRHLNEGVQSLLSGPASDLEDPDGRSLRLIHQSAERLNAMIGGLLLYSRVHTRHQKHALTSLDRLLDSVLRQVVHLQPTLDLRINREPLPEVMVDAHQIETVFFHLVDNAVKYRSDRPLELTVKCELEAGMCAISLQDNGQGIETRNQGRVFIIFQRNHHQKDVPGLGLGLALSRRIVERHGGQLTVESTPGEGSTFTFTLPDRP